MLFKSDQFLKAVESEYVDGATVESSMIDQTGMSDFDKELIKQTLLQIKMSKINMNPNFAFKEFLERLEAIPSESFDLFSGEFKKVLRYAKKHISQLNAENKAQIVDALGQVNELAAMEDGQNKLIKDEKMF